MPPFVPDHVHVDVRAHGGRDVLRLAAEIAGLTRGLDPVIVFDALWRREQAGSTGIGHGVAIPHARVGAIDAPFTLYFRLRQPIPFAALDGADVRHLLVLLVPRDEADQAHLDLLARVAARFAEAGFRRRLDAATDADAARAAFATWPSA